MTENANTPSNRLTHLDSQGRANMVDVSEKTSTLREAQAHAWVRMRPETLKLIQNDGHPKGDVFTVARIAGIMAATCAKRWIAAWSSAKSVCSANTVAVRGNSSGRTHNDSDQLLRSLSRAAEPWR